MRPQDVIAAKRDGQELADNDLGGFVLDYACGRIPDYQMSAFLMATFICGLTFRETVALTRAMIDSGNVLDLTPVTGTKVDKHSSGGVGDKTTLVVVPTLAACGLKVPKMSGRGLGFTGGTLDKLESIPGFTTDLSVDRFVRQVQEIGAAMAGQSGEIVPADKKIYALRDVTATVDSIPLIAASIMSKKIACSSDVILIDVKVGSGAFMQDMQSARELSRNLIEIGKSFGRKTAVAITDMSQPLGNAVGNSLEVSEAIDALRGAGPSDLRELCIQLCAIILHMVEPGSSIDACSARSASAIDSGEALGVFRRIIEAQGGDTRVIDDRSRLPRATHLVEAPCSTSGVVSSIDCASIGRAASILGAGRDRKEDAIDPAVGIIVRKKVGDRVSVGESLATIHANDPGRVSAAHGLIIDSYTIGNFASTVPLIHDIIY